MVYQMRTRLSKEEFEHEKVRGFERGRVGPVDGKDHVEGIILRQ